MYVYRGKGNYLVHKQPWECPCDDSHLLKAHMLHATAASFAQVLEPHFFTKLQTHHMVQKICELL